MPARRVCHHGRMPTPSLRLLTELLDRSIDDILDAAQPRTFDRLAIVESADMWDNGTPELFAAVLAGSADEQERLAREAIRWMGTVRSGKEGWFRRTGLPGDVVERLVPRPREPAPRRDGRDRVVPGPSPVTPSMIDEIAGDYDVAGAAVEHLSVEHGRNGTSGRLVLGLGRWFAVTPIAREARLELIMDGVTAAEFDSADHSGVKISADDEQVDIEVGSSGRITATRGDLLIEDAEWHLSRAGRAADLVVPARRPSGAATRMPAVLPADIRAVERVLHRAMLEIRSARYPAQACSAAISETALVVRGTGAALARIADLPDAAAKEGAVSDLLAGWSRARWPGSARWVTRALSGLVGRPDHAGPGKPRYLGWTSAAQSARAGVGALFEVVEAVQDLDDGLWSTRPYRWEAPERVELTPTSYRVIPAEVPEP